MSDDKDMESAVQFFSGMAAWMDVTPKQQCCWAECEDRCTDEIDRHIVLVRPGNVVLHLSFCFKHFDMFQAAARDAGWKRMNDAPVPPPDPDVLVGFVTDGARGSN